MRVFRDPTKATWNENATTFAIGAVAGLVVGMLLTRVLPQPGSMRNELQERARSAVRRLRPARLQRLVFEQEELDDLEDAVLEGFLKDDVLRDRGIDIGAISKGIIELSGGVESQDEIQRAVALANRIPGVRTVVNRLQVESAESHELRRRLRDEAHSETFAHQEGRVGGMGRRRQGVETDPDRPDDSQKMREDALAAADRDQWVDEGYSRGFTRAETRPGQTSARPAFREDELDNQDPHGKSARALDSQPQELRTESRVGEGTGPVTEHRLDDTDFPLDQPPIRDDGT